MCHFITTILPAGADVPAMTEIARRHRRGMRGYDNPNLRAQLAAGESTWLATSGHCDCGTGLGTRQRRSHAADDQAAVAGLRRKGWSETKISRWREQRSARPESHNPGAEHDLLAWQALLQEALGHRSLRWYGLLLHQYSGSFGDESFPLQGREAVDMADAHAVLANLHEDRLYAFHRTGSTRSR